MIWGIEYGTRFEAERALKTLAQNPGELYGAEVGRTRGGKFQIRWTRARQSGLSKIKAEAVRIGTNGTRVGHEFAERLFRALPELRNE